MRVLIITATLLALAAGSPAFAADPVVVIDTVAIRHVTYADLNLASAAGVHTLYSRVRAAAEDICEDAATTDFMHVVSERFCFDHAMSGATAQIEDAVANAERRGATDRLVPLDIQ